MTPNAAHREAPALVAVGPTGPERVNYRVRDNMYITSKENYLNSSRVKPLSPFEIKSGWDIPAILEQGLNSGLPGEIRALVRENVDDTASGNYLLIPQGSRLVGLYDSRIA